MRPLMMAGLALAVALTAWGAFQDDSGALEAVRPEKGARSKAMKAVPPPTASRVQDKHNEDVQALVSGVTRWQERAALAPSLPSRWDSPWASQRPPPPPVPVAVEVAPPPPMAPAFPHAWAGRFNDRAIVAGPTTTWVVARSAG